MGLEHIDYVQATCDCCGEDAKPKCIGHAGDDGWRQIRIDKLGFTAHFGGVLCPACAEAVRSVLMGLRSSSDAPIFNLRNHKNELPPVNPTHLQRGAADEGE